MPRKLMFIVLAAALYGVAQGDTTTVTLKTSDGLGFSSWARGEHWSDGAAPSAGKAYVVPGTSGATLLRTPEYGTLKPFAGDSLTFENGAECTLKHPADTTASANYILYGAAIRHGVLNVVSVGGTIDVRGTADHPSVFSGSGAGGTRVMAVTADMSGEEDAVVKILRLNESDYAGCGFVCLFSGDNSNYKGTFFASAHNAQKTGSYTIGMPWQIGFASQAALGAPRTDGSAKLTLDDGMVLKGGGLALTNGYKVVLQGDATFWGIGCATNSAPFSELGGETFYLGKDGVVEGTGTSTLTVAGDAGPLVLDGATLTGVSKIVVQNGAGLYVASGTVPALAVEAGGALRYLAAETEGLVSCNLVRVEGDLAKPATGRILMQFDSFPFSAGVATKVALLTAANLGTDVTAEDFAVTCPDAALASVLAEGAFAIETIDGRPTLVFIIQAIPALVDLTRLDPFGAVDSWARGTYWSDGQAPSADKIYRIPSGKGLRRSMSNDSATFGGRTLMIESGGSMTIKGLTANVNDLRLFAGSEVSAGTPGQNNRLSGNVTVYGTASAPAALAGDATDQEVEESGIRTLNLDATLKGTGTLCFRYSKAFAQRVGWPTVRYLVTGDNTAFTGNMALGASGICADFKDEKSMGGPAEAFVQDRLLFESNATLRVTTTYAIADPTRGITVGTGGGRIDVDEGQTLTISNRIAGTNAWTLRKDGKGTLALCCDTNTFGGVVKNGTNSVIRIGAANAVANAWVLVTEPGAVWIVDVPEGMTVKRLSAIYANSEGAETLVVAPRAFETVPSRTGKVVANLVRIKGATAADAETALARVVLDASALGAGWKTTVAATEVDGALLLTATATRQGAVFYVR